MQTVVRRPAYYRPPRKRPITFIERESKQTDSQRPVDDGFHERYLRTVVVGQQPEVEPDTQMNRSHSPTSTVHKSMLDRPEGFGQAHLTLPLPRGRRSTNNQEEYFDEGRLVSTNIRVPLTSNAHLAKGPDILCARLIDNSHSLCTGHAAEVKVEYLETIFPVRK